MKEKSNKKIMGNGIETIREIDERFVSTKYRGSISLEPNEDTELPIDLCPTKALSSINDGTNIRGSIDHGKCIMCGYCSQAAPKLVTIKSKPAIPVKTKRELIEYSNSHIFKDEKSYEVIGNELGKKIKKIFGRSLAIREIDAGSCNGCEIEITALNNPIYDIERFGIHFVSSPRHADVLLVTGPASKNMEIALRRTYEATPNPKIVIAVGACACSGGIFGDTYATTGGIDKVIPVDVYIPGCPPRPEILIQGLLLAVDRMRTNGI